MVYTKNFDESFKQYRTTQRYFRFVLTNQNEDAEGDDSGFIDPLKPQDYADYDPESGTLSDYESKARGNLRWINLCVYLSRFGVNYMQVNEINHKDLDAYEEEGEVLGSLKTPWMVTFTMGFDNANYMYYKNSKGEEFTSNDEIDPYEVIESNKNPSARVLKAIVADFMINNYKGIVDTWNPTKDTFGKNPSDVPLGLKTEELTANKLISDVSDVDGWVTIYELNTPEYPQDIDSSI